MKFKKIELHAFRAYKNKENGTFDFTLPNNKIANFVSIYAPNGFGKTSFYDGVEWAVTKKISRFSHYQEISKAERKIVEQMKGHREKQYVLKNKDSDDKVGYVRILSEDGKFFENLTSEVLRAGSTDFGNNAEEENEYFKNVILSQDGIDNFLKTDDDKRRFDKFIVYFGNQKINLYHDNIKQLEDKNNQLLKEIQNKIDNIIQNLNTELNESVFDDVNKILIDLDSQNPKFEVINDSFDEIKKLKLDNQISEQIIDVNSKIDYFKSLIDKLPSILKNSEKYFNEKYKLKILQDKLDDYIKLNNTYIEITHLKNKLVKDKKEINYLEELKKDYPIYENNIEILENNESSIKNYKEEKLLKEQRLNEINIRINEIKTDITLKENRKNEIINSIKLVPSFFENIKIAQKNIDDFKQKIESNKKISINYKNDIKNLEDQQKRLQKIKYAIQNNIFIDIDSDDKYKTTVEKIEYLLEKNELNNKSLSQIKDKKIDYQQYNKSLKELISLGMNIIQNNQDSTCPLCNQEYSSYDTLQENILNNPLLDNIEKDLLKQEEEINLLINRNNRKITEAKESITLDLDSKLSKISNKLNESKYKLNQLDLEVLNKNLSNQESSLLDMLNKVEQKSKYEYLEEKNKELNQVTEDLVILYEEKKKQEPLLKNIIDDIKKLSSSLDYSSKIIDDVKLKKGYKLLHDWINTFKYLNFNVLDKLNNDIEFTGNDVVSYKNKLNALENVFNELIMKHNLIDIKDIPQVMEDLKNKEFELTVSMKIFKDFYSQYFKNEIGDSKSVKQDISKKKEILSKDIKEFEIKLELIQNLQQNTNNLLKFISNKKRTKELEKYKIELSSKNKVQKYLKDEREKLELKINSDVESFFHEDLINQIYSKIDPHPEYKRVKFKCSFENTKGKLNIFVNEENENKHISPALYYSTAQLNVLSLSIFLAKALNVKDDDGNSVDCIFIDDPIQSMDSINILSTIDLLRSLVVNFNKQIILSTHDENFHYLLQKKIPTEYFDSKFIELETFGKVKRT